MRTRPWLAATLLVAIGLLAAGAVLAIDNPTISNTSEGTYECLAPYDSVVLGSGNGRGGRPDGPDISKRCDQADSDRFVLACVLAGLGVVVGAGGAVVRIRRRGSV